MANNGDAYRTDLISGISYQVSNYLLGVVARWNLTGMLRARQDVRGEQFQVERFRQLYNDQQLRLNRQSREADTQYEVALEQARAGTRPAGSGPQGL